MNRIHTGFGVLLLVLLLAGGYSWLGSGYSPTAPVVNFKIIDGRLLNLQQFAGQPVLVVFWATTCPACIKEIPHLMELYEELAPRGLEIIGVAMAYDPPNQVIEMQQRKQIPYPIALDVQGKVASAFGEVQQTPTVLLINPEGRIAKRIIGRLNMSQLRVELHAMLPRGG